MDEFTAVLRSELPVIEDTTFARDEFPSFDISNKDGELIITLIWRGKSWLEFGFDGSMDEAVEAVRGMATIVASGLSTDYWLSHPGSGSEDGDGATTA